MNPVLLPSLQTFVEKNLLDFSRLTTERKKLLNELAEYVKSKVSTGERADLIFICTHNSRRSHISQLWAQTAATYYGIHPVTCYSGGTEATAFNLRAVKAMAEAGFRITQKTVEDNPTYEVIFSEHIPGIQVFSKVYDHPLNPLNDFAAVMTCSHADENCPFISGASKRIALTYNDPKDFDNTPLESSKYAERVVEIGNELFYTFSLLST